MMNESRECGYIDSEHPNRKYYRCQQCGQPFWKPDAFRKKYCSSECQSAARTEAHLRKIKPPRVPYNKTCQYCGEVFVTYHKNKKYCCKDCAYQGDLKMKREQWAAAYVPKSHRCKECGTEFMTECRDLHSVFCCQSCAEKHERRAEHETERHRAYMKKQKKKREKQIAASDSGNVDYEAIYARDHGVCKICGLPVHVVKRIDNNWDGTIDHIQPLSLGGKHSMDNCQLAHRICNSLKLQETQYFSIDWKEKAAENNYWRTKFEDYCRLMNVLVTRAR